MEKYKIVNGTFYHKDTNDEVIRILEICRRNNTRIVLDYGDIDTGKSWGEIHDITGRVSRSTGEIKIPILVHNSRSWGGGAINDKHIISIKTSLGKVPLYTLKIDEPITDQDLISIEDRDG